MMWMIQEETNTPWHFPVRRVIESSVCPSGGSPNYRWVSKLHMRIVFDVLSTGEGRFWQVQVNFDVLIKAESRHWFSHFKLNTPQWAVTVQQSNHNEIFGERTTVKLVIYISSHVHYKCISSNSSCKQPSSNINYKLFSIKSETPSLLRNSCDMCHAWHVRGNVKHAREGDCSSHRSWTCIVDCWLCAETKT